MSFNGRRAIPHPFNEPIKSYAPGTPERAELKRELLPLLGDAYRLKITTVLYWGRRG